MHIAAPGHDRVDARHELRKSPAVLATALALTFGSGDVENGTDAGITLCCSFQA